MTNQPLLRRRGFSIAVWSVAALVVSATAWWRCTHRPVDGAAVEWSCAPAEGNQVICRFAADDETPGFCVDVTLDCDDGAHRGTVCSGALVAGSPSEVPVALAPPLPDRPVCQPPTYANRRAAE
jgi:hypothetical protein